MNESRKKSTSYTNEICHDSQKTCNDSKITCNIKCGSWQHTTVYYVGDMVKYEDGIWIATDVSINIRPEECSKYWFLIYRRTKHKYEVWKPLTHYVIGDIVRHNNRSWVAIKKSYDDPPHIHSHHWFWISDNRKEVIGFWNSTFYYDVGDLVVYNNMTWACILPSVNNTPIPSSPYWFLLCGNTIGRSEVIGNWNSTISYEIGDLVVYNNMTYACISQSLNNTPSSSPTNWFLLCGNTAGTSHTETIGLWNSLINYEIGDIVVYNNMTYACIAPSLNNSPPTSPTFWFLICGNTSGSGGGGGNRNVLTLLNQSTDYNATLTDQVVQIENIQNINVILPLAALSSGQLLLIVKISNNAFTINVETQGGDLINGLYTSVLLNDPYSNISVLSNGISVFAIV